MRGRCSYTATDVGSYWMAADGNRSIDLSGNNAGSVSQTIATVAGKTYRVSFDLSGNPDAGSRSKVSVISVSGSLPDIQTYTLDATNSRANMNWKPYTYTFTAFDTTSTLTFASAEKNAYGPALDNVTISAVPEPQTWGLMLAGFVMVGAASRRRKGVASLTA